MLETGLILLYQAHQTYLSFQLSEISAMVEEAIFYKKQISYRGELHVQNR